MLHKTRGIVLHTTNYSESSVIARIYTELFGLQGYLINGVRNKKAKVKFNLLQPLSLLNLVVYHKEKGGLQRISEIRPDYVFTSLPYRIVKSSICLFMTEVLNKVIHEEEVNPGLFEFIYNSTCILDLLDETDGGCGNFHLAFLLQLSKHLGFFPYGAYTESRSYFNLKDGVYQGTKPLHPLHVEKPLSEAFYQLSTLPYASINTVKISKADRKELVEKLLSFYELHVNGFSQVYSHYIFEEIML
jgi:DNA repair protein RecO (recombination protein O)